MRAVGRGDFVQEWAQEEDRALQTHTRESKEHLTRRARETEHLGPWVCIEPRSV